MKKPLTPSLSFAQKSIPLNYEEERLKFLFDQNYNPQFQYEQPPTQEELLKHGVVNGECLALAKKILDKVVDEYGTEENFHEKNEGRILTHEETLEKIRLYLRSNDIEERVTVVVSPQAPARTSLKREGSQFILQLRAPLTYREIALEGMLNHEIGTHLFRWLNEMNQPWFGQKSAYHFQKNYLETEEGIATIQAKIHHEKPYLWGAALNYYLVTLAAEKSFSQVNAALKKYVSNPEKRWKHCFKVKRGVVDTSEPQYYSKNKIYLEGAVQVANWLNEHDYQIQKLYIGKVSIEDLDLAWQKSKPQELLYPHYFEPKAEHMKALKYVVRTNRLQSAPGGI